MAGNCIKAVSNCGRAVGDCGRRRQGHGVAELGEGEIPATFKKCYVLDATRYHSVNTRVLAK